MRRRIEDDEDERPARPYITPELVEAVERHVATGHTGVYRSRAIVPELGVTEHLVWVIAHRPEPHIVPPLLTHEQVAVVEWLLASTSLPYRAIAAEAGTGVEAVQRIKMRICRDRPTGKSA